jgi:glycosyltransferase involved in cell wall biosynthesis
MRIGVDGRAFTSPAAGVRRYVSELYRAMLSIDSAIEVVAIGAALDAELPAGMQRRATISFPTNLGWMAASIPLAARGAALDVFHAPAYTAPLWGVHPQVLTIHDVSYERRPDWNAYKNDRFRRLFYRRSANATDAILTDSEFSKHEIVAAYGIPAARIRVVPLAASDAFTPGPFDPSALPAGIRQPYALHVGDLHVRRNLSTALAAVLAVRLLNSPNHEVTNSPIALTLVCAGIDRGVGETLRAEALRATDPDSLVLTGPVRESTLLNLYRGAAMLLYPSRYEGFGLPVLEAMRCGIPVVAARAASIPELTADAAVLLDPMDVDAWTQAIIRVMSDHDHASELSAAGVRRASTFSWTRTAGETLEVLRTAAGAPRASHAPRAPR